MIIKKLTISNFRSYYGTKEFEFSDHLNLILGSNGDGKTTFFEALNWVLTPDYAKRSDDDVIPEVSTLVSAKMFKELKEGERGKVCVAIELKNNSGSLRIVERQFFAVKGTEGKMLIEDRCHRAYRYVGSLKRELPSVKDVFEGENAFPAIIKKYHIFKGEDKLNIFNDKTTLQTLIDMFSEIKDIEPYKAFADYAERTSQKAIAGSKDKADKANQKLLKLQGDISALNKELAKAETDMAAAKKVYNEAKVQIDGIGKDYEVIQKAAELEKEIAKGESLIPRFTDKIDEDYNIKLLDEQWILMGFTPILKEYNRKMTSFQTSKNNIEDDYRKKQEDEIAKARVEKAVTHLEKVAWNRQDVEKMKHSLHTHHCVYCGTDMPEGSAAYDSLKQRIHDVIELLTPKPEEKRPEIKKMFAFKNIEEMSQLGNSLLNTGKDIEGIADEIESANQENNDIRAEIADLIEKIVSKKNEVHNMYANSSTGENLKEYVSNITVVNKWHEEKSQAALTYNKLRKRIPEIKEELSRKKADQAKNAKASGNGGLLMIHTLFRLLSNALENTSSAIYEEFLARLAKEANVFLSQLNVDDFTGVIKIYLDRFNDLKIELQDKNGKVITNPNTSLLTTMHISILFAISELTRENRDAEYPLIFDAPTSSFDEGKDKTFYECLNSQVNKQCIVVTKSYLYKDDNGEFVVDEKALSRLNCKKYRIKKLTGFDKLDITTIDTQVEELGGTD